MPKPKQIFITGVIDEWTADELGWQLRNSSETDVNIYISSFGGSVKAGFEIANLIQGIEASGSKSIHTFNLSQADSIATVIFLAAKKDKRHIVENSTLFIHEPRAFVFDEMEKEDAEKLAERLEIETQRIADFYVKNIEGLNKEEALELMSGDTTLNASRMLELGLVSEVQEEFNIAASTKLISNKYISKMGLFGKDKKETINKVVLNDGKELVFAGDLKEGTEINAFGGEEITEGEYITADNQKLTVNAESKVVSIEAIEVQATNTNDEIIAAVGTMLADLEAKMDAKIEALRKVGSKGTPPKTDPVNKGDNTIKVGSQRDAQKNILARVREETKKHRG